MKLVAFAVVSFLLTGAPCDALGAFDVLLHLETAVYNFTAPARMVQDDVLNLYDRVQQNMLDGGDILRSPMDCLALSTPAEKGYTLALNFTDFVIGSSETLPSTLNALMDCNKQALTKRIGCYMNEVGLLTKEITKVFSDTKTYRTECTEIYSALVTGLHKCLGK